MSTLNKKKEQVKKINWIKILPFFILFCNSISSSAQQLHEVLNHEINSITEKKLYFKNSNFHTSIRPFYHAEVQLEINNDSIKDKLKKENRLYLSSDTWWAKSLRWTENKWLDDDLIKTSLGPLKIRINPAVDFTLGKERINNFNTWLNTRGFNIDGTIGKKISFNTAFFETQALFLPYVKAYTDRTFIVPGQGRWKLFKEGTALDYGISRGIIAYRANNIFTFQFGHGKNFLGEGYRSLLLSDNATNYPFLKIETKFWNIKYINIIGQLNHMGFSSASDRLFDRKYFATQYLSWNITKRINFSLFEMVTWKSTPTRNFDLNYINPIVFLRPVEFQNGSLDKMMIGATSRIKLMNNLSLYGQLLIDDLRVSELRKQSKWWGNKYGVQAGIKAFDLFKLNGLSTQIEYNTVRPYTYSHFDPITAYSQLNQSMAHPLGANFREGVGFVRYNYKRHYVQLRVSKALFGLDTANINHGQNIFYSYDTNKLEVEGERGEYGHLTLQGLKTSLDIFEAKYAYMINPSSNLMFEIGITNRMYKNDNVEDKTQFVFIGIKTSLSNFYYDFL